jgi:hypothetical protein
MTAENEQSPHEATKPHPAELNAPIEFEPSAQRAAERINAWYRNLEPRLGVHLADPNVVLTLADARGQTEFFVDDVEAGDVDAFNELSRQSTLSGVRFTADVSKSQRSGRDSLMVNVENLVGVQLATGNTRLPGIPRFDAASSRGGYERWKQDDVHGISAAHENGLYPKEIPTNTVLNYVFMGVIKGYPDVAIVAAMNEKPPPPGEQTHMRRTQVPYADYYDGAQPNFSYDPENRAAVDRRVAEWGTILSEYYHSDAHRRLASEREFKDAREVADRAHPDKFTEPT